MKTFYETVLQEFEQNVNEKNLCYGSETFSIIWDSLKCKKIRSHAKKFIKELKITEFNADSDILLFSKNYFHPSQDTHREIRLKFLRWCIENKLDIPG